MRTNVFVAVGGLIVGIVIALVLVPLLFPPPPIAKGPCSGGNPNDHCIDVMVIMVGGQPQIALIADEQMKARGEIFWTIKNSPGYSWPANGIDFANPGGTPATKPVAPAGEFTNCGPMPGNTTFKCHNGHGTIGSFGYKVTLATLTTTPPTPPVPSLDPWIINN
jgi:hypothetical protein